MRANNIPSQGLFQLFFLLRFRGCGHYYCIVPLQIQSLKLNKVHFMIHNAWTWSAGNRNDLLEVADFLAQVDETIADIYHIRTGIDVGEITDQMDAETWITGKKAVETGFADGYLPSDSVTTTDSNKSDNASNAAKRIDTIMAMQGIPRSERRALFNELKLGTQNATTTSTQNATVPQDVLKALQATAVGLKNLTKET